MTGLTSFQDALAEAAGLIKAEPVRAEVKRTRYDEDRAEIDIRIRKMIYKRDGYCCRWCGNRGQLTLDHVIPWSAGGTDRSDNLRTLCWDCNEKRSNYVDNFQDDRLLGVVQHCWHCNNFTRYESDDDDELEPVEDFEEFPIMRVPVFCNWCAKTSTAPQEWIL